MEAMTILRRCRAAQRDISTIELQIARRREVATMISAPQIKQDGAGHAHCAYDRVGAMAPEIADLEAARERRMQRQAIEMAVGVILLDRVKETESRVLYHYYIRGMSTGATAKRLHYQQSYVRKCKARGEAELEAIPGTEVETLLPPWYLKEEEGKT